MWQPVHTHPLPACTLCVNPEEWGKADRREQQHEYQQVLIVMVRQVVIAESQHSQVVEEYFNGS